jgi:hypothetical protein
MSEGQPPPEGPAPYTERDLDDLLSGNTANVPEALRLVATTLDALRRPPVRDELDGEAGARAAFRMFASSVHPDSGRDELAQHAVTWHNPAGVTRAARAQAWDDPAGQEPPVRVAAGVGAHPVARTAGVRLRQQARHRAPRRGGWRALTVVGTAAGAVMVGVAALAVVISGSGGQPTQAGSSTSSGPSVSRSFSSTSSSQVLGVGASKEPVASPAPSSSGGSPSAGSLSGTGSERNELCRQYFEFFTHPESANGVAAESALFQQLSQLAGSPEGIVFYCMGAQSRGDSATSANAGSGPGNGAGDGDAGNNGRPGDQLQNPSEQGGPDGHGSVGSVGSGVTGSGSHSGGPVGVHAASQFRSVQTAP